MPKGRGVSSLSLFSGKYLDVLRLSKKENGD